MAPAPDLQDEGFGNFVKQLKSFPGEIGGESSIDRTLFLDDLANRELGFGGSGDLFCFLIELVLGP
jgi:hypothetical protein